MNDKHYIQMKIEPDKFIAPSKETTSESDLLWKLWLQVQELETKVQLLRNEMDASDNA